MLPFRYTFDYMTPALVKGYWRQTQDRHVWEVDARLRSRQSYEDFMVNYRELVAAGRPYVVFLSVVKMIFRRMAVAGGLFVSYQAMLMIQPILLSFLLATLADEDASTSDAILIVCMMGLAIVVGSFGFYNSNMIAAESGLRARSALVSALFSKVLTIKREAHETFGTGQLAVLMQNDVQRILDSFRFINFGLYAPVQIFIIIVLLWVLAIGPFALIPVSLMGLTVIVNLFVTYRLTQAQRTLMTATDARVKMESEVVSGIRIVKNLAWEEGFMTEIALRRNNEIKAIRTFQLWRAAMLWFMLTLPTATIVLTFSIYALSGNEMSPDVVFPALLLINQLRFPFAMLPVVINLLTQYIVSMERVALYLGQPDGDPRCISPDGHVRVVAATFRAVGAKRSSSAAAAAAAAAAANTAIPATLPTAEATDVPLPRVLAELALYCLRAVFRPIVVRVLWLLRCCFRVGSFPVRFVGGRVSGMVQRIRQPPSAPQSALGPIILRKVSFEIPRGHLCMVVGRVGSGKTTLVQGVLSEVARAAGSVEVPKYIAYCPQSAWIVNATVRQNIIMALPFCQARYDAVLQATTLDRDLPSLASGDHTMIGERGINLSGGQKQRIAIARSIYADKDLYIFDDPLSAVDVHVGKHLFEHVFRRWLRGKTVLLTTNQLQFLSHADNILVLDNFTIRDQGDFLTLMQNSAPFAKLMETFEVEDAAAKAERTLKEARELAVQRRAKRAEEVREKAARRAAKEERIAEELRAAQARAQGAPQSAARAPQQQPSVRASVAAPFRAAARSFSDWARYVREVASARGPGVLRWLSRCAVAVFAPLCFVYDSERRARNARPFPALKAGVAELPEGSVSWRVWIGYVTGGRTIFSKTFLMFVLCIAAYLLWVVTQSSMAIWLGLWSGQAFGSDMTVYLVVYDLIAVVDILFAQGLSIFLFAVFGLLACKSLHTKLVERVVHFPVSFFDTTMLGAILNRFVRDTMMIDLMLPGQFQFYVNSLATIGVVAVTMIVAAPWMVMALASALIVFRFITSYFEKTYVSFQRLEAESRGPLISHFTETIQGVDSVRAYGMEVQFVRDNRYLMNNNNRHFIALTSAQQWLGMRLDWLAAIIVLVLGMSVALLRDSIAPGLAGASLSYALQLPFVLNSVSRFQAETQNMLNHVERVMEYYNMPTEGLMRSGLNLSKWPSEGRVEFRNYYTRYRKGMPYVLRNVSFVIEPRMKVGIVGRTGAGKSSLLVALFRVVEAVKGSIVIDGRDISKLGLTDLRSKLSIIPQDPTLFLGTVRSNLDPFSRFSDAEIWEALDLCELKSVVLAMSSDDGSGLEALVSERGSNFSVGQRQLLCMARALLRGSKILIMDEATASVDLETDALIQTTVRSQFNHCTVITIAHRLDTIIDSDRVLVLDKGRVVEYDHPSRLLENPNSQFKNMVDGLGLGKSTSLKSMAELALSKSNYQMIDQISARDESDEDEDEDEEDTPLIKI